jgi:hypothetical protein
MANKNKGHFGKLVIGEEAFLEEQKIIEKSEHIYGPAVTGKHPNPVAEMPALAVKVAEAVADELEVELDEAPEDVSSLSVREIREEVKGDITAPLIDRLMRDELFRAGGPRKSVLEILRSKEAGRESPRPEVIGVLEGAIEELE